MGGFQVHAQVIIIWVVIVRGEEIKKKFGCALEFMSYIYTMIQV